MIGTNILLKLSLPGCNDLMIRFCGWSKIIGFIITLLVQVHMHMWHPTTIKFNSLLTLGLCQPSPISVQIEIIMIRTTPRPGLLMFPRKRIGIVFISNNRLIPVHIPISSIWIQTGVYQNNCIREPYPAIRPLT